MAPPKPPRTGDDDAAYGDRETKGLPRWVKLTAIVLALIALIVLAVLLVGGGHTPRPHG
jgi:hypothetical protein